MNNNILIVIVILLVLAGGGWYLYSSQSTPEMEGDQMMEENDTAMMEKENTEMMEKEEAMTPNQPEADTAGQMEKPGDTMMTKGSYEAYAPEKLAKANEGDVVLFFRASWCPTCRALHANIQANVGAIPAGVTILDVDYDNSTALKQKYGVTYQHTLVQVDANGSLIKKWMGSPTLAGLIPNIQ